MQQFVYQGDVRCRVALSQNLVHKRCVQSEAEVTVVHGTPTVVGKTYLRRITRLLQDEFLIYVILLILFQGTLLCRLGRLVSISEILILSCTGAVVALVACSSFIVRQLNFKKENEFTEELLEAFSNLCDKARQTARTRVDVKINTPQMWHLNWLLTHPATQPHYRFLLPLFPNVKEITESIAMFRLVNGLCKSNAKTLILVVGDGTTPRTAALFARLFQAPCTIHCMDPLMRTKFLNGFIQNDFPHLICHRTTVEEWLDSPLVKLDYSDYDRIVVVAVHSHAKLDDFIPQIRQKTMGHDFIVATLPCCVPQTVDDNWNMTLIMEQTDWGVLSPARKFKVWRSTQHIGQSGL